MTEHLAMAARRFAGTAVTLVGMVLLVFLAVRLVPGDPVDQLLGDAATEAERAGLRTQMHLDGSLSQQLWATLGDLADGSLGTSYALRNEPTPVIELILENAPHTISLALASLVFAILLALPLGLLAAVRQNSLIDHTARGLALIAISTPAFVSGPLALYVLAVLLHVAPTPAHQANGLQELLLPACVIGFALSGRLARILRATALEQLRADYVTAARLRGISEWRVLLRHVLPNAALPVLTVLGLQLAALLGGALVTERIFARPGIGTLLLDGISARDHAVVQACALVVGASYAVVNGSIDVLYRYLDPRLRLPRRLR